MIPDPLKSLATLATMLVALIVLAFGGWWLWTNHSNQSIAVKAQTQAGVATVAGGQAQARAGAQQIVVSGQARDRVDLEVHQANDQAITAAPGADDTISPQLDRAVVAGLCQYPAYAADPGCAGLREDHPAVLPDPDPAGPAPPN